MILYPLFLLFFIFGFILFKNIGLPLETKAEKDYKVSVLIPARNEEKNLPNLLSSLQSQSYQPFEVIVIDDFSSDKTAEVAESYHATVIKNSPLPEGWTGKNWALWNGYRASQGDIIVFLDADVRLAPHALISLLRAREKSGGAISVIPYHYTEKFYEKLSLLPYILGLYAFTSPFERKRSEKGLYGSCIVTDRGDYEKINGHNSVKAELLDDLTLGRKFANAGVKVENFLGSRLVSFRMYPYGIKNEMEGFSKGAALSTATLKPATTVLIAIWLIGLLAVEFVTPFLLVLDFSVWLPFVFGYLIYTLQIFYFIKISGRYGLTLPLLHFVSSIFFIIVMLYSLYQVNVLGAVSWKGRQIQVGRDHE